MRQNSRVQTGLKKLGMRKAQPIQMSEPIKVSINSNYDSVEQVASVSRNVCLKAGFDDETCGWVELAVREAVINAIKHGNRQADDKQVDVQFVVAQETLTVYVRDQGPGFDLARLPDPLDPQNLLNPEGRGIFFMRTFMDTVDYFSHPDGGCVVRMQKLRTPK
jgi:serine/threonine-protein kinase RsbW